MAQSTQTDGLTFGIDRILRLDKTPEPAASPPSPESGRPVRWPSPPAGLTSPLAAVPRQPVPLLPRPPPPLPQRSPTLLPAQFCPPPGFATLLPLGAPGPLPVGQTPAELWPLTCHHLLHPADDVPLWADSRLGPPLGSGRRLGARRKRTWTRAVFTNLQRKGLEKRFQIQRYITKPERRKLAETLGLTDSQVKVWFQNRRMKWRNARRPAERTEEHPVADSTQPSADDDTGQPINVED